MTELKPRMPIRRFDVFAEYNRIKSVSEGMQEDRARGEGIWIAKVVAGRRGMPARHDKPETEGKGEKRAEEEVPREERFKSVGGEPQTDATFRKEIVDRMGTEFYERVFSPAIDLAFRDGQSYQDIRDSIRKDWKR